MNVPQLLLNDFNITPTDEVQDSDFSTFLNERLELIAFDADYDGNWEIKTAELRKILKDWSFFEKERVRASEIPNIFSSVASNPILTEQFQFPSFQ